MKNARNQHRTDYAKELVKIVQTTKDREELKKKDRSLSRKRYCKCDRRIR